jgi:hypothetical protein
LGISAKKNTAKTPATPPKAPSVMPLLIHQFMFSSEVQLHRQMVLHSVMWLQTGIEGSRGHLTYSLVACFNVQPLMLGFVLYLRVESASSLLIPLPIQSLYPLRLFKVLSHFHPFELALEIVWSGNVNVLRTVRTLVSLVPGGHLWRRDAGARVKLRARTSAGRNW